MHREPTDEMFSKDYKDKLTISNYKIGIKRDGVIGDMNLDKALQKYLFYSELTTPSKAPKQRLPRPGDDVRPPMPVGPTGMMRERILALSLAPSIVVSKLKGTVY